MFQSYGRASSLVTSDSSASDPAMATPLDLLSNLHRPFALAPFLHANPIYSTGFALLRFAFASPEVETLRYQAALKQMSVSTLSEAC